MAMKPRAMKKPAKKMMRGGKAMKTPAKKMMRGGKAMKRPMAMKRGGSVKKK